MPTHVPVDEGLGYCSLISLKMQFLRKVILVFIYIMEKRERKQRAKKTSHVPSQALTTMCSINLFVYMHN